MVTVMQVPASSTVRNVTAVHAELLVRLIAESDLEIDLSQIEEVDLSLPQLLTSLRVAAAELGRTVRLRSPAPTPVAALLERAGFLAAATPQDLEFWFHGERAQ